jgi:hypothetical protein
MFSGKSGELKRVTPLTWAIGSQSIGTKSEDLSSRIVHHVLWVTLRHACLLDEVFCQRLEDLQNVYTVTHVRPDRRTSARRNIPPLTLGLSLEAVLVLQLFDKFGIALGVFFGRRVRVNRRRSAILLSGTAT